jgi:hypothetical protein
MNSTTTDESRIDGGSFKQLLADLTPIDCYFAGATPFWRGHHGAGVAFPGRNYGVAYHVKKSSQEYGDWKALNYVFELAKKMRWRHNCQLKIYTNSEYVFDRNGDLKLSPFGEIVRLQEMACVSLGKFEIPPQLILIDHKANSIALKLARVGIRIDRERGLIEYQNLRNGLKLK